jgi:hypothetical protein
MRLTTLAVLGAALLAPAAAGAQGRQDFVLLNNTGYTITEVYVSASRTDDWEEDILGWDTLDDGQRVTIAFPRDEEACLHDLKVLYVDGEEAEWSGMNLCETSVIGLRYDRRTGETWADQD